MKYYTLGRCPYSGLYHALDPLGRAMSEPTTCRSDAIEDVDRLNAGWDEHHPEEVNQSQTRRKI